MLMGSCLCGSGAYEVDAPAGPIVHCHCETCRKTHGSAFSSVSSVPRESFRWTRGEDLLSAFGIGKCRLSCFHLGQNLPPVDADYQLAGGWGANPTRRAGSRPPLAM